MEKNIVGVYIECDGCEEIEMHELIPIELKVRVAAEIETIFTSLKSEKGNVFFNVSCIENIADYIIDLLNESSDCMLNMFDIKNYNEYAYVHSMQVGIICTLIGKHLNFSSYKLKELTIAGMLHDIGKINIPTEILDKDCALTDEEFEHMKEHPSLALMRLQSCKTLSPSVLEAVSQHHEKLDGTGYPKGLTDKDICEYAKIIAIADVYDALTSSRSYRGAWDAHKAIEHMMSCADTHFDTDLLNAFLAIVAAYPNGVLVKLNNDLIAVVIKTLSGLPLTPIIQILSKGEHHGKIINMANDKEALTLQIVDTIKDITDVISVLK